MRTGLSANVSIAIGMAIFVITVATAFLLLQGSFLAGVGFSGQVGTSVDYAFTVFQDRTGWTLERTTIATHSDYAVTNQPLAFRFPFPASIDPDSILVMQDGRELASQHDTARNTTVVVTNLTAGVTWLTLVHTGTDVDDRVYETGLEQAGSSAWNEDLNVTFSTDGFADIVFKDLAMLESAASIGASTTPSFVSGPVRVNATYDEADRKSVRVFADTGQIRIDETFTGEETWQFNLTSNFTELYSKADGGTTSLSGTGVLYADSTDFVDFYDVRGLAFIGNDLFVNVTRETLSSPIQVAVNFSDENGGKRVWLHAHDGNYTNAQAQQNVFHNPYNISVGAPVPRTGISRTRAAALEARDEDAVRDTLGLTGLDYNISIPGVFRKGRAVTTSETVRVYTFPVTVVARFGNASIHSMDFRVWNR